MSAAEELTMRVEKPCERMSCASTQLSAVADTRAKRVGLAIISRSAAAQQAEKKEKEQTP